MPETKKNAKGKIGPKPDTLRIVAGCRKKVPVKEKAARWLAEMNVEATNA
jgi:hypothetical protein